PVEVLDILFEGFAQVVERLDMILADIVGRHADKLLVHLTVIFEVEHADSPARRDQAMRQGFVNNDQRVQRIAVVTHGVGNVAVVRRVAKQRAVDTIQNQAPGLLVQLDLVSAAFLDLDYYVYDVRRVIAIAYISHTSSSPL